MSGHGEDGLPWYRRKGAAKARISKITPAFVADEGMTVLVAVSCLLEQ